MNLKPFSNSRLFLALGGAILLAACGGTRPTSIQADGEFERDDLRTASSLIVVPPEAQVLAFEKSFAKVYGDSDALSAFIARALADSLNKGTPALPAKIATWMAPDDSAGLSLVPGPDSAILETGARFVLRVRDLRVTNALRDLPVITTPGQGSSYEQSGGGTSESCVVSFTMEIWETEGALVRRHAFVATGRSDVFLWAYQSALKEAVRRAVQGTARYLRGS